MAHTLQLDKRLALHGGIYQMRRNKIAKIIGVLVASYLFGYFGTSIIIFILRMIQA